MIAWRNGIFRSLLLLGSLGMGLPSSPVFSAESDRILQEWILKGIDFLHNVEFSRAEAQFDQVIRLDPNQPIGYVYKAIGLNERWKRQKNRGKGEGSLSLEEVDRLVALALERANPQEGGERREDPQDLLTLALILSLKAQRNVERKEPFTALKDLRRARECLVRALELDPHTYDAHYGLGLGDYYLSYLSPFHQRVLSVIFVKPHREKGLRSLVLASEKGCYTKMSAKMDLLHIYVNLEQRYCDALPIGRELVRRYPGNPDPYFPLANALSELERTDEAFVLVRNMDRWIQERNGGFDEDLWPRYHHLLGKLHMDLRDDEKAFSHFQKAVDLSSADDLWIKALALVRTGMLHDQRGERDRALSLYREVIALHAPGVAREWARKYQKEPYAGRKRGNRSCSLRG